MLSGTCHCGAVTWTYAKTPDRATACNCSVCAKAGVLWIYGAEGEEVRVTGTTTAYVRADLGDLEFHHCPTCGNTISWWMAGAETGKTMALNLRLVDDPAAVAHIPIRHFDGRDTWSERPDDGATVKDLWF